ncbi:TPA: hypothetical protein I9080_003323 [Clostridium perfringens]|uniref:Uncharacterized protein n=1 Tax=Clostridium perfringens TaxID=1502 RepID=A0A8H9R0N4_CLOPF|nr:hypothetical protein [Clostridium perfringens]HAT4309461.1 hypothetical protein [Clostridium perfringens]HAT4315664.1 hypothetical protein [Clostridium perfringens]HAT4334429.1 hypothetical protein [Clostridium perfringens]
MKVFTFDDLEFIAMVLNKILDANKSNIKYIKKKEHISKSDIEILMEYSKLEMKLRIIIDKIELLSNERNIL